jgi:hypothetical protein
MNLSNTKWTAIGPAPTDTPTVGLGFSAGRIEVAAPDPTNADVMYIGANGGGVWKTGVWNTAPQAPTWIPVSDDQPSLNFAGYHPLVVHPANKQLVLGVVSGPGAGILKSTNGGLGWQLLANSTFEGATLDPLPCIPRIRKFSICPYGPGRLCSARRVQVVQWRCVMAEHDIVSQWARVRCHCRKINSQHLYAGLLPGATNSAVNTAGVYRSTNAGVSWQLMTQLQQLFSWKCGSTGVVFIHRYALHRLSTWTSMET